MAGNPRLKGQECFVSFLVNNTISAAFNAVVDLTVTDNVEQLSEDLLGEVATRNDDIYRNTTFSATLQIEDVQPYILRQQIIDRSKRRAGSAAQFDLSFAAALPTGQTRQIQLQDIFFGPLENAISSRSDFVTLSLEGVVSDVKDVDL